MINITARAVNVSELWFPAVAIGNVVRLELRRILLTADTGGETTNVRFTDRGGDRLSIMVIDAVPACKDIKSADAIPPDTGTIWLVAPLNVPSVVAKVTVDAPGADTVMVFAIFVTKMALFAGEVTANTAVATPLA